MHKDTLTEIRNFICFNQKNTIKYEYIISEKHKEIKKYFTGTKNIDSNKLERLYDSLIISSYENLLNIFEENKLLITNIFNSIGKESPPRINIKTIQGNEVLNIYNSSNFTNFHTSLIKKNTGFSEILHNNKYFYLENNIPDKYINFKYKNVRIEGDRILLKRNKISWKECWVNLDNNSTIEYYSSTLILPMSIRSELNDKKDILFYNHFFKDVEQHKDSRTIWGFLCFDDTEINYFKDENKTDFITIGYIIADMLSLYLMYFYNHISGSSTILDIEKKLC